jgi:hypothetical protein
MFALASCEIRPKIDCLVMSFPFRELELASTAAAAAGAAATETPGAEAAAPATPAEPTATAEPTAETAAGSAAAQHAVDEDPAQDQAAEPASAATSESGTGGEGPDVRAGQLAGLLGKCIGLLGMGEGGNRIGLGQCHGLVEVALRFGQPGSCITADRAASGGDEVLGRRDLTACREQCLL